MITLKCPKCSAESKLSFVEKNYEGPRRCWKCHEYFTIKIEDNELKYCEPLSQEDYEKQKEIEALKAKFRKQ
jgi:hypothetical protein